MRNTKYEQNTDKEKNGKKSTSIHIELNSIAVHDQTNIAHFVIATKDSR